jgi:hypothetical protein
MAACGGDQGSLGGPPTRPAAPSPPRRTTVTTRPSPSWSATPMPQLLLTGAALRGGGGGARWGAVERTRATQGPTAVRESAPPAASLTLPASPREGGNAAVALRVGAGGGGGGHRSSARCGQPDYTRAPHQHRRRLWPVPPPRPAPPPPPRQFGGRAVKGRRPAVQPQLRHDVGHVGFLQLGLLQAQHLWGWGWGWGWGWLGSSGAGGCLGGLQRGGAAARHGRGLQAGGGGGPPLSPSGRSRRRAPAPPAA